jgi:hypothetical protein
MERFLPPSLLDDPVINQLVRASYANEALQKAIDFLCKRMESGEMSDHMLLRTLVCLSKSNAPDELPRRPRRRRSR